MTVPIHYFYWNKIFNTDAKSTIQKNKKTQLLPKITYTGTLSMEQKGAGFTWLHYPSPSLSLL